MKKVGLLDYYLDEWHAHQLPRWISAEAGDRMKVTHAWAKIDSPLEDGLTNKAFCIQHGLTLCDSEQELIDTCDYIIVLSPDNPEMHWELSQKSLATGKPVYIDKTFAPDRETATKLFQLAEQHNTPMFSTSSLRYAEEYVAIKDRPIYTMISSVGGPFTNYLIHLIEPVVMLMGTDVEQVQCLGDDKLPVIVLEFADGRQAFLNCFAGLPFITQVRMEDNTDEVVLVESDFFLPFVTDLCRFFEEGISTINKEETIAVISIYESAMKACKQKGQWVAVQK